jgi:hypothetical protein
MCSPLFVWWSHEEHLLPPMVVHAHRAVPTTLHRARICESGVAMCLIREILDSESNFWQMQFAHSILRFAQNVLQMAILCVCMCTQTTAASRRESGDQQMLKVSVASSYLGVTMVLQWCYSGVTVVLQWC